MSTAHKTRPLGTCPACRELRVVRLDGLIPTHRVFHRHCPGGDHKPVEGILMECVWCSALFLSEDEDHRFCSEACVADWEERDGSWEGWDLHDWLEERRERDLCNLDYRPRPGEAV